MPAFPKILCTALLAALCTLPVRIVAAPWQLDESAEPRRAVVENDRGDRFSVWLDSNGVVTANFRSGTRAALNAGSCPTFQVDARLPLHHYRLNAEPAAVGTATAECRVADRESTYRLLTLSGPRIVSPVLYQLMNGNRLIFRFATVDGAYHEAVLPLTRSKQALSGALGDDLEVLASDDSQ